MRTISSTVRAELEAVIAMGREAVAWCQANGEDYARQAEVLAANEAKLAGLGAASGGSVLIGAVEEGRKSPLTDRPKAGSAASNQYGTFSVKYASAAQTGYIRSLLARKDTTKLTTGTMVLDLVALTRQVEAEQVNKRAASDIIDSLLGCPDRAQADGSPAPTGRKASDKQVALIRRLAGERELSADDRAKVLAGVDSLSTKGAPATIDKLFALPKDATPAAGSAADLTAGMYIEDATGTLLRVYLGQQSGQLLCKKVVAIEGTDPVEYDLEYQGRADRFVTASFRRMDLQEAKVWGKATGHCCVCARRLDVPESVDAGIGPKCAGRL